MNETVDLKFVLDNGKEIECTLDFETFVKKLGMNVTSVEEFVETACVKED